MRVIPADKISIVIPAYNAEKYLDDCLTSILNQTRKPDEIIVVNDGSTDNTVLIAEKYGCRVLTCEENRGIGFARYFGAKSANGDYVAFLSADDAYSPDFIASMLPYASRRCITFCDYFRCNNRLMPIKPIYAPSFHSDEEFRELTIEWALRQNMFVNFSTILIPKWVFRKVQFDESLRFGEDLIFLLETLAENISWHHVNLPLVYYRVHGQAGTFKGWTYQNWLNLWIKLAPLLQRLGVPQQTVNNAIRRAYWNRFHPLKKLVRSAIAHIPEFWYTTKRASILRHGWKTAKKIVNL